MSQRFTLSYLPKIRRAAAGALFWVGTYNYAPDFSYKPAFLPQTQGLCGGNVIYSCVYFF
jgi:hypothetical protein